MRTLVWITNSFRKNSRLTNTLTGECTFVYYSPYHFAGDAEVNVLKNSNQSNLNWFYYSINKFAENIKSKGFELSVFRKSNPIDHINQLIDQHGYDKVVFDMTQFSIWHNINLDKLNVPYEIIDSNLIRTDCRYRTAKHRWMDHAKCHESQSKLVWNSSMIPYNLELDTKLYPQVNNEYYDQVLKDTMLRFTNVYSTYGQTRDKHDGQTNLSVLFTMGLIDAHNIFYQCLNMFLEIGADPTKNEGDIAAMLRQFAFREMTIIKTRERGMNMENTIDEWTNVFIDPKSLANLKSRVNEASTMTYDKLITAQTGIPFLDKVIGYSLHKGVMPNRARMWFAGKIFYEAPSGIDAINWLIRFFNEVTLDGQCPTTYTQCCDAMGLQYGKVMLLNENRVKMLLDFPK